MKRAMTLAGAAVSAAVLLFGLFINSGGAVLPRGAEYDAASACVMKGGRLMPLSSAAADTLRSIGGRASAKILTEGGSRKSATATEWLAYINAFPLKAAEEPFFRTDNRELQNLLGADGRYYSYNDLDAKYDEVAAAASSKDPSPFSAACREALEKAAAYECASNALAFYFQDSTPRKTFEMWRDMASTAKRELDEAKAQNRKPDTARLSDMYRCLEFFKGSKEREEHMKDSIIYAAEDGGRRLTPLDVLLDPRPSNRKLETFSRLGDFVESVSAGAQDGIAKAAAALNASLPPSFKIRFEDFCNRLDVFYRGALLYVASFALFLLAAAFKDRAEALRPAAFAMMAAAFAAQTFGVFARMIIQMRPPVTNLYSSVIFAGWAAAAIGIALYLKKRRPMYAIAAAPMGFMSILVALNLPYSGDTMGMMRAVLNSNFWLATHIVPMMLGYCGVFLAGVAASFRLIANVFSKTPAEDAKETASTVYAVLCFAMVFSFAGTMLGGVWADMSWGRFWGWDPKENGALMAVLWCALVVHCRALRICSDRAVLAMAAIGNIVAAWAWFGVNMLGVGLHSYGFMSAGWKWLILFAAIQAAIAFLPPLRPRLAEPPSK